MSALSRIREAATNGKYYEAHASARSNVQKDVAKVRVLRAAGS